MLGTWVKLVSLAVGGVAVGWITTPSTGFAQGTTATILGVIRDQSGAPVPGAKIAGRNLQTGASRACASDYAGRFRIFELALGEYEVKAEHDGFRTEVRRNIVLTLGRDAVVNFTLSVGPLSDEIVVSGDAPPVNTTTSEVSTLVGQRMITGLPLNGRDLIQLATLQAGVVGMGSLTDVPINSGTGAVKMSINGGRVTFNNFLLDGSSVNEAQNTTPGSVAGGFTGVDAVREFQLLTSSYGAEFGGAGAGVVNLVTKSGTNELHGSGFEFLRNSALDARNFFDRQNIPPFRQNQFGMSAGGPIRKNRTFLFGAYEGLRQRLAQSRSFFVPDTGARLGASPAAKPYVDLYPEPNAASLGGGLAPYIWSESGRTTEDYSTVRMDQILSSRDTLFGRYTIDDSESITPDHVISNSILQARNQYITAGETHVFLRMLNSARLAFNRSRVYGDLVDITAVPKSLVWTPGASVLGAFLNIGGLSPLSDRTIVPRFLVVNSFEGAEQIVATRAAHTFKAGATARRIQLNAQSTTSQAGTFIFGSYAAFLAGTPQLFAAPLPGLDDAYRGIRTTLMGAYFQDDWKLRRNLTATLGLRYEPMSSPDEVNGKLANLRDPLRDKAPTAGSPFFKNNTLTNFAPRLGLAWDPRGDGKMAIRAGYGVFFAQLFPNAYRHQMSNQPPYFLIGIAFSPAFPNAFPQLGNVAGAVALQTYEYNPKPAYVQQWNVSVQRELDNRTTAVMAYVGSRGAHLPTTGNVNTASNYTFTAAGLKQYPATGTNPLRNPAFGPIIQTENSGDSYYQSLQASLQRKVARGLQIQTAYTFSKSIDTTSDANHSYILAATQYPQDIYNLRADRGLSVFDVRQNVSLYLMWSLPSPPGGAHHILRSVFGDWEWDSIVAARTGTPFNPILSFNNSRDGNTNSVERPDWAPGFTAQSAVTGSPDRYFNPAAFALPPSGQYGTAGRDVLTGPSLFSMDVSLVKAISIAERSSFQLRAEAFNLLNHANFTLPDVVTVFTSGGVIPPNVGSITRTSTSSRQLQFGLRFLF